ncbi:hypothetical protein AB3N62_10985 [Leptospira sp. WS4.C2]
MDIPSHKNKIKQYQAIYRECRRLNLINSKNISTIEEYIDKKTNSKVKIKVIEHGRHLYYEALDIKIGQDHLLFPIKRSAEIQGNRTRAIDKNAIFEELGWIIPPYFSIGSIQTLAAFLKEAQVQERHSMLEQALAKMYHYEYLSALYSERYAKIPLISDYKEIILEAIKSHASGFTYTPIISLIAVIEGTSRSILNSFNISASLIGLELYHRMFTSFRTYYKTKILFANYDWIPPEYRENSFLESFDQTMNLVKTFENYIKNHFYSNSKEYTGIGNLNRNGIIHGFYLDYNYSYNFLKLITVLDLLCFILSWKYNFSLLGPDSTPESLVLYDELENLSSKIKK